MSFHTTHLRTPINKILGSRCPEQYCHYYTPHFQISTAIAQFCNLGSLLEACRDTNSVQNRRSQHQRCASPPALLDSPSPPPTALSERSQAFASRCEHWSETHQKRMVESALTHVTFRSRMYILSCKPALSCSVTWKRICWSSLKCSV